MKLIELTKVCPECKNRLVWNIGFYKKKTGRFGLTAKCKICSDKRNRKWRKANPEKVVALGRKWRLANPEKAAARGREWNKANPERAAASKRKWAKANSEKKAAYNRKWYNANLEKAAAFGREWRNANSEKVAAGKREWRLANPEKATARGRRWEKKQYQTNDKFRLNKSISSAIRQSLNGNKAGRHWETLVGYTLDNLRCHLEKQFTEGMSWESYGEWHLEHKIPQSVFNFISPDNIDFKRCWALKNLQPMFAKENMSKGAKLTKHFQPSLLL